MEGAGIMELATLGGGCFWCLEAIFQQLQGVGAVRSGYAGGSVANPTYADVCDGETGHAEVVQLEFDPREISYREILEVFFVIHDPTTKDRQGADVGPQYRSVILTHSPEQKEAAEGIIAELEGIFDDPIVTELASLDRFYEAEKHHQDFYFRNRTQPYCRMVIDPKLAKFRKTFAEKLKPASD